MRISNDFRVPAPPGDAYELLVDLERVATCIPGGEVGPPGEEGAHPATIKVRLGPMQMSYRGTVRIAERDDAARRAVLSADVREQRGQGTAKATMEMSVSAADGDSLVATVTDVTLTGRAAQMGRGVVDDVATRLVAEMADCIASRFGAAEGEGEGGTEPGGARPISGLRLAARVFWDRVKRLFRPRGGPR